MSTKEKENKPITDNFSFLVFEGENEKRRRRRGREKGIKFSIIGNAGVSRLFLYLAVL